jgi:hypothetical protein
MDAKVQNIIDIAVFLTIKNGRDIASHPPSF